MNTTLTLDAAELGAVELALFEARDKGTAEQRMTTRLALAKVYEAQKVLQEAADRRLAAEMNPCQVCKDLDGEVRVAGRLLCAYCAENALPTDND